MNQIAKNNVENNVIEVINQSQLFGCEINVYGSVDEPLFLAKDVALWIEHSNARMMLASVGEDEKVVRIAYTNDGNQLMWFLTEDGLYEVLMASHKPIAKQLRYGIMNILHGKTFSTPTCVVNTFQNEQFGKIRTAGTPDNPLFCLADICKIIELSNPSSVKSRLDKDDTKLIDLNALKVAEGAIAGNTMATFVTESGFYDVILYSKSDKVKPFRKWVTSEVLPSIRKTGQYNSFNVPKTFAEALQLAANQQIEIEKKEQLLLEQQPKVKLANVITESDNCFPIKELAAFLAQRGVDIGPNRLYKYLRENGYLCSRRSCWNLPNHKYIERGLFEITESPFTDKYGNTHVTMTVWVTGKGLEYFVNKLYHIDNN